MEANAPTVAVIGLGALGLVTAKNLLEEGFNVTGFDKNTYIGGLWHYTDEDRTSVLTSTVVNISKENGCFTDFPFPENASSHCTAAEVQRYLEDYAAHFGLMPHLRLGIVVRRVSYEKHSGNWQLDIEGSESLFYDKVVIATGINQQPNIPKLTGGDIFTGLNLHSRAFKRPDDFKGKSVLVVGLGNTGADTVAALHGHAKDIYLSHSHGAYVMPRIVMGRPLGHAMTARVIAFQGFMDRYMPSVGEWFANTMISKIQNSSFKIRPEWKLSPAPSIRHATPIISDNLIPLLEDGGVKSVSGLKRATGPNEVELEDGTRLTVDAIIWCTGYKVNFDLLEPSIDPTLHTTSRWSSLPGSRGKPLPRLYQNVLSLEHPMSLAIMGCVAFATGAFPLYDLASMAVVQIWKGSSHLPHRHEMEAAVDRQHAWVCETAETGSANPGWVRQYEWVAWAHKMAGTGVDEYLGWGWKGWKFWATDHTFCSLLLSGLYTPHLLRVFAGKRTKWDGARAEIERVNKSIAEKRKIS